MPRKQHKTLPLSNANHSQPGDKPDASDWAKLSQILGPVQWDWPGWLPRGFLTILASEPGAGKSLLCLRLAACYLHGVPEPALSWPDSGPFTEQRGKVVWCESEASHALNVERANRWGLDLSQILIPLANPLHNFKLDNPQHHAALLHLARRESVRLVILDSLRGLRSGGSNAVPIGQLVLWLADFARIIGKPVLLTHHLRKRTNLDASERPSLDRLLGASAIAQSARVIWAIDSPDPARPHHRRLSVIKNNLARFPEPVGMIIDEEGIHFGPPPEAPTRYSELDRAVDFLRDLLAAGPLPFIEIQAQYRAAGHSYGTIRRAKKRLAVASIRPSGVTEWYWTLPQEIE